MKRTNTRFPDARIPYGTWGGSYFPAWQSSPLAEVNICQFAGEGMNRILGLRKVPKSRLDYLVTGSTVPWHWKFWNSPLAASCMGTRIPGFHVEQACATGLQAVAAAVSQVQGGSSEVAGVLTFDRTSDSPVGVFPERRSYRRTEAISDVWDNFAFDPATGKTMMGAAGNAARKYKIDRQEVDDAAFLRHQQYFEALDSGFLKKFLVPMDLLNVQGRAMGTIDSDTGVSRLTRKALGAMRQLDTCVSSGTQTHAADGMACLLVSTPEKARELSSRPEISIRMLAKTELRTHPSLMPEAPALTVKKLLQRTGLKMGDMDVVKSHNPFAVNDVIFAKELSYDWREMNKTGCSLVWGHPQGPTLTRLLIEGLEETVELGGGRLLLMGCAAGDVGIAAIFEVGESGRKS